MVKVGVSILDANFGFLQDEIEKVNNADFVHFDIMDGHFVPNLTYGTKLVRDIETPMQKVVHLMIENPEKYVEDFIKGGADSIILHLESCNDMDVVIEKIRANGAKVGIALNPETKLHWIRYYLDKIDSILVMSINPGFSGQEFIYESLSKIDELRQITDMQICVDGGINMKTGKLCVLAGADALVSSSFVFRHNSPRDAIENLRNVL
jgi:ribulose-phosphate 3-epimerase